MALSIWLRKLDTIKWVPQWEAHSWEAKDCTLCMQVGVVVKNWKILLAVQLTYFPGSIYNYTESCITSCAVLHSTHPSYIGKTANQLSTARSTHAQLIGSFPWTPARRTAYSHLLSIHRVVHVRPWNYIQLAAQDESIPVFSSLRCYTGTVHYRCESAWEPALKRLWKPAWEPSWESLASWGVEFPLEAFGRG
jgi:hypothetical protein